MTHVSLNLVRLKGSTCFEHYLFIIRRRYTSDIWYIACVLCQLAAIRIGVELVSHTSSTPILVAAN
jgi:uncharacterized membrane protein